MSYTEIFVARADGDLWSEAEFPNSYHGAMAIWLAFSRRYCHNPTPERIVFDRPAMQRVWALAGDESVCEKDRITLATTFDRVLVPGVAVLQVADCLEHTAGWIGPNHLAAQAAFLRSLTDLDTVRAVGWNQTSVNADAWREWDAEADEGRPYNLDRDTGHWWIFEGVKATL